VSLRHRASAQCTSSSLRFRGDAMDGKRRRAMGGMGTPRSPAALGTPQGMAKWKTQAGKLGKLSRNTAGSERTYIDQWKVRAPPVRISRLTSLGEPAGQPALRAGATRECRRDHARRRCVSGYTAFVGGHTERVKRCGGGGRWLPGANCRGLLQHVIE